MVFKREQFGQQDCNVDRNAPTVDSVQPVESCTECPTAELPISPGRSRREAMGVDSGKLNPTPVPAVNDIGGLSREYQRKLHEVVNLGEYNQMVGRSSNRLYRELAMLQIRLADLIRIQEAKNNPQPGPIEVLGYTIAEFMEQFGGMLKTRQLRDLDRVLRFMAPIKNPQIAPKEANQAIHELITQLTFGDEPKDEWTSPRL